MPHLDDGQIAEWIDSAERRDGGTARREVEQHLQGCAVCRERVDEARRTAERARAILGAAAPAVTAVPPFADVLHRAGRRRMQASGGLWLRRLAWAATVVMAGGLGWYGRGAWQRPAPSTPVAVSRATADSIAPLATAEQAQPEPGAVGGVTLVPPAAARRAANEAAPARQEEKQERADAPTVVAAKAAPRESVASEALRDTNARAAGLRPLAPAPAAAAAAAPSPSGNALGLAAAADERAAAGLVITRDAAERALGGSLATIPGLPVERYELLAPGPVVRVIQTLPSGAKLELVEWAVPGTEPEVAAGRMLERFRGARELDDASRDTVTLKGLRVTARAAVAPDSLRRLLGALRR